MSGRSKRENGAEQRAETGARNARGQFLKGSPGGPGRGHRRKRSPGKAAGTARSVAAGGGIAYEELASRLELAERKLDRLRGELADERAASVRQSREWAAALHALERFPDARRAVLDEVFKSAEEAERDAQAGQAPAGASVARPGGEPAVPADPGVPLPAEKREEPTIYDGSRRGPVPPGWGGRIETRRPRQRGVDGIGDRYGDSGPLTSQD